MAVRLERGYGTDRKLDIISAFEAVGSFSAGKIREAERHAIECHACPAAGACGGMYTANTMATAMEAIGIIISGSASVPAMDGQRNQFMHDSADALTTCIEQNILPSDILTRNAFENSICTVMALGGSTNAVLHLLAIANEIDVPLTIDDFNAFYDTTPILTDMKPAGTYVVEDLYNAGGVQIAMKILLEQGLLHGNCLTVSGNTIADNLANVQYSLDNQQVTKSFSRPDRTKRSYCGIKRKSRHRRGRVKNLQVA